MEHFFYKYNIRINFTIKQVAFEFMNQETAVVISAVIQVNIWKFIFYIYVRLLCFIII